MMKKVLIIPLLCLAVLYGWADEQRKMTLGSDNTSETINLSYCNIFVALLNPDSDDPPMVQVEVENLDETKLLALFCQPYAEKQVKKLKPSFQYDKLFGGTKGKRIIDPYSPSTDNDFFIEPSGKYTLGSFRCEADKQLVVKLPIYLAKGKKGIVGRVLGKEKLLLLRKQVIEIDIDITTKPSAEYLSLQEECESLKREVKNALFCTAKKHKESVEEQQEPYKQKINDLKSKIDAAISAHGWNTGDKGYKNYAALKDDLDKNIDLDAQKGICRQHRSEPKPSHQCSYCNLSLQQIYHRLDDLYKKIYTSADRKATKQSVMGQVNALYGCCTAADCAKHASQWKRGGDYKSKIIERYNRIQGL